LVDLALAQDEKVGLRPYDLKKIFESDKEALELVLFTCLRQEGDITLWLKWFFEKLLQAIQAHFSNYEKQAEAAFFSKKLETYPLNFRQKKLIHFLLGSTDKSAAITNRQCVEICQASRESIKRDLKKLVELGLLRNVKKKGRSVAYILVERAGVFHSGLSVD
jgi:Fic family protein